MDMTVKTRSEDTGEGTVSAARQATVKNVTDSQRRFAKKALFIWVGLGMTAGILAGLALGVLVMRARQRARKVVISINGVVIDQSSFYHSLEGAAGAQVIRGMIGEELQVQFARKLGVAPSDSEVEARLAQTTNKPDFNKDLLKSGEAMQDLRRSIRVNMARNNVITRGVTVTDADIRSYYNVNIDPKNPKALFYTPERVTLQVIVNPDETIIKRAEQDLIHGVAFALAAKNYSTGDGKDNDGMLPTILRSHVTTGPQAEIENTFFGMKIGEQIGPRKFNKAWWIIRCLDKQLAQTKTMAEAAEACRIGATLAKGVSINGKKVEEGFKAFQQTANVQAFWGRYNEAANVK